MVKNVLQILFGFVGKCKIAAFKKKSELSFRYSRQCLECSVFFGGGVLRKLNMIVNYSGYLDTG